MNPNRRSLVIIIGILVLLGAGAYLARELATAPAKVLAAAEVTQTTVAAPSAGATAAPSSEGISQVKTSDAHIQTVQEPPIPLEVETQFLNVRSQVLAAIPTQDQLRKLPTEQVHFTPKVLMIASLELGKMAELLQRYPILSSKGLSFYKECAEREGSPESVRASCLVNFIKLSKSSPRSRIAIPTVPTRVQDLAYKIMS
jgi:hypothetical protein